MGPGSVTLSSSYVTAPSVSNIDYAIYVAAPSTPATIVGTNITYQPPQGGGAAAVNEIVTQQVTHFSLYSY